MAFTITVWEEILLVWWNRYLTLAVIFADDGQDRCGFVNMADFYFDSFADSKPATVRNKKTVAIYRMCDCIDYLHAVFVGKCLWQPGLA
jgi:hypothetical protein